MNTHKVLCLLCGWKWFPQTNEPKRCPACMSHRWNKTVLSEIEKFSKYFIIDPINNCWNWKYCCNVGGYGIISFRGKRGFLAHRASWILYNGEIKDGLYVCHKCDNTICVNPDHLFLGTRIDNLRDAKKKGRLANGSRNGLAKLTDEQIIKIRNDNRSQSVIAKIYNIHQTNVHYIKSRKTWKTL
jgi:hypothetical protein